MSFVSLSLSASFSVSVSSFLFVSLEMSLFPSIFVCTVTFFSLYRDYVVPFIIPDSIFDLVTMGWMFDISLFL